MKRIILVTGILCLAVVGALAQASPAASPQGDALAAPPLVDETTMPLTGDTQNTSPAASGGAGFGIWDLLRMLVILGLVVAAIYGVFYLIKRGSGQQKVQETELIKLLGSQGLPGNRWVHLINVQKQVFLIGSSDASVSLIAEITDQESIDEIRFQAQTEKAPAKSNFAELLGGFFGGESSGKSGKPGAHGPLDFIKRQRDRLKKY